MARYKVSFICKAGDYGWSETWYKSTDLLPADVALNADGYVAARRPLLGYFADVYAIRVTNIEARYVTHIRRVEGRTIPSETTWTDRRENPWTGGLFHIYDAERLYRRIWLCRCLSEDSIAIGTDNRDILDGRTSGRVGALVAWLRTNGFTFRALKKVATTALKKIAAAELQAITRWPTMKVPGHGLADYSMVTISKCTGTARPYLNGRRKVRVATSDDLFIETKVPEGSSFIYSGGGVLAGREDAWPVPQDIQYLRFSHRDTGGPFGQSRGRRRVKR